MSAPDPANGLREDTLPITVEFRRSGNNATALPPRLGSPLQRPAPFAPSENSAGLFGAIGHVLPDQAELGQPPRAHGAQGTALTRFRDTSAMLSGATARDRDVSRAGEFWPTRSGVALERGLAKLGAGWNMEVNDRVSSQLASQQRAQESALGYGLAAMAFQVHQTINVQVLAFMQILLNAPAREEGSGMEHSAVADLRLRVDALERQLAARETISYLNTLLHEDLEVTRPIAVVVEEDDGDEVAARWSETLLHGEGSTILEALQALRLEIVAAYLDLEDLVREGRPFDGYVASLWAVLERCVERHGATSR